MTLYDVTRPYINNDSTCGSVITRCVWFKALTRDTQIARLFYGGMGCLLWVYSVSYGTIFSLSCCMQCRIILNRVKMGPGRITNEHSHKQRNILSTCNCYLGKYHNDVIKWKHFPRYWHFVRGIHRSSVNSPHKFQWRGALVFSLIYAWINGWVNNRELVIWDANALIMTSL